ncbi:oxalurate catabolism protein HpxZ [Micromonospora sp. NBC_01813]|uniref:oxalurate catabolism protein HpxZ n=1 Tax=Micromonospora sp. NBC_01813 TaxID=2975988 RepID=UPI002DD9EB36|nr:oxalurate catabolism protein HpxZ [Micromonospora sp. NBC_01813]WSA12397.1 oxalurate catabolism protein HpxZ [Micromonospora sp. NBC_01813]
MEAGSAAGAGGAAGGGLEVNRPEVLTEVNAAFADYEQALVDNDVAAIVGWFWPSEQTVRFGIADHQYGIDEQRRWRAAQSPLPPGRRLSDVVTTTFGTDFAVVTCRFDYPGGTVAGRQSQTWVRGPAGWRIVSAHVSEPAGAADPPTPQSPAILHLSTDK